MLTFITLAQTDPRIEGAVRITEQASSLGGNVFLATLVILVAVLYVIGVVIPNARSQRANTDKLTDVIAKIGTCVAETHEHASNASQNTDKLVCAMRVQTNIVERVNDAGPKLDIKSQLGEIRGALS
jgi:hypothetical protein